MPGFGWSRFGRDSGSGRTSAGAAIVSTAFEMTILLKDERKYL